MFFLRLPFEGLELFLVLFTIFLHFSLPSFKKLVEHPDVKLNQRVLEKYHEWLQSGKEALPKSSLLFSNIPPTDVYQSDYVTCLPQNSEVINVLGQSLCLLSDLFQPRARFNVSKKIRGCRPTKDDLNRQNLKIYFRELFSLKKRFCLAMCHSIFDPFGLWSVLGMTMKVLYQQILINHSDFSYESVLPEGEVSNWEKAIDEVFSAQKFWARLVF